MSYKSTGNPVSNGSVEDTPLARKVQETPLAIEKNRKLRHKKVQEAPPATEKYRKPRQQ
jgi:hypothetical protein